MLFRQKVHAFPGKGRHLFTDSLKGIFYSLRTIFYGSQPIYTSLLKPFIFIAFTFTSLQLAEYMPVAVNSVKQNEFWKTSVSAPIHAAVLRGFTASHTEGTGSKMRF